MLSNKDKEIFKKLIYDDLKIYGKEIDDILSNVDFLYFDGYEKRINTKINELKCFENEIDNIEIENLNKLDNVIKAKILLNDITKKTDEIIKWSDELITKNNDNKIYVFHMKIANEVSDCCSKVKSKLETINALERESQSIKDKLSSIKAELEELNKIEICTKEDIEKAEECVKKYYNLIDSSQKFSIGKVDFDMFNMLKNEFEELLPIVECIQKKFQLGENKFYNYIIEMRLISLEKNDKEELSEQNFHIFGCEFVNKNSNNLRIEYKNKYYDTLQELTAAVHENYISYNTFDLKFKMFGKIQDMVGMFSQCKNIELINFIRFDTTGIKSFSKMFLGCKNLTNIQGLGGWDTSSVSYITLMFSGCGSLTNIDNLDNWDMSKISIFDNVVEGCNLKNLNFGEKFLEKIGKNNNPYTTGNEDEDNCDYDYELETYYQQMEDEENNEDEKNEDGNNEYGNNEEENNEEEK